MDSDDEGRYGDGVDPELSSGAEETPYGSGLDPSFFSDGDQHSWGNFMQNHSKGGAQEGAKSLGRFVEDGAAKTGSAAGKNGVGNSKFMSAVQNAKNAEGRGGFANNVQGKTLEKAAATAMPGGKMIMNQAKKLGPFGTILIIVGALVGIFAGTQSLAPFGLLANGLDQFNNLRTSMNRRTTYFKRFTMDKTRNASVTKATIFSPEHFSVSKRMKNKLGKQHIYYFGEKEGYSTRFMVYEDKDTGKRYAVTAKEGDIGGVPDSVKVKIDGEDVEININTKMKIDDALIESDNFSRSFDVGTRTLKGHIAGWFDDLSAKLHFRIGSTRNKFKDTSDVADDDEVVDHAKHKDKMLDETIPDSDSETDDLVPKRKYNEETGEWEEELLPDHVDTDGDGIKKGATQGDIEGALKKRTKAVVGGMKATTDIACTIMKAYSMLSVMMAAIQVANILNYVTGYFEAIDRTKAGDAGRNELSYYMTGLSKKGTTLDADGNVVREDTNSLQSPAWNQFFSSGSLVLQSDDKIADKFNRDKVMQYGISDSAGIIGDILSKTGEVTSNIAGGIAAYKACLTTQGVMAAVDLVVDIVLAFLTVGIGTFIKQALGELWKDAILNIVMGAIVTGFMALIPQIAQWMAKDIISNMAGEDAAYAINSGFNIYAGQQMQMSSGLPADEAHLMAHWREQQEVIAEEGEFERSMRSPFDPTSKYTFLGSIVNSLMPIANTWSSPLTTISKTTNAVGTALMGLRPTANAEGEAKFETSLRYDCANLSQINLVGDVFCNPYFVTDFSTMEDDPSDVIDEVATDNDIAGIDDNFKWDDERGWIDTDDDGEPDAYNPTINPGGELSKWVVSCAVRDTQFGLVDSNVMSAVSSLWKLGDDTLNTVVETGVGMLPFVGDAQDIANAASEAVNLDWATGENCKKEEYKYFSRYSEDQRMMESAGIIDQSAVVAFLEDYYKENPIDNSYEGIIARYSGYTKEEVISVLDTMEYIEWLAEYNPTNYGPEKPELKNDSYQYESNDVIAKSEAIIGNYIIFDDLRTRVKVA